MARKDASIEHCHRLAAACAWLPMCPRVPGRMLLRPTCRRNSSIPRSEALGPRLILRGAIPPRFLISNLDRDLHSGLETERAFLSPVIDFKQILRRPSGGSCRDLVPFTAGLQD
jgi:hypothetical protein